MAHGDGRTLHASDIHCYKDNGNLLPGSITLEKSNLVKLASRHTSCAGCIAAVKRLLAKPLSELRMLSALTEEAGCLHLRVRSSYTSDKKKTTQLLNAFPMSSVLKKVECCEGKGR
ncbi:unnamed protein product [Choristocarpus tenellus]